jgi:hypothetical protein
MTQSSTIDMVHDYFLATTKAVGTLFKAELYGHVLIVIYSTIDTCGLLDAPADQTTASSPSFKAWVTKYLLPHQAEGLGEIDLWAARCAVLHTFTSESNLSTAGLARQLQYYSGDKSDPKIQHLIAFTRSYESGKHLPVHYGEFCEAFFAAIKSFVPDLEANCNANPGYLARLRKILQVNRIAPAA